MSYGLCFKIKKENMRAGLSQIEEADDPKTFTRNTMGIVGVKDGLSRIIKGLNIRRNPERHGRPGLATFLSLDSSACCENSGET